MNKERRKQSQKTRHDTRYFIFRKVHLYIKENRK